MRFQKKVRKWGILDIYIEGSEEGNFFTEQYFSLQNSFQEAF